MEIKELNNFIKEEIERLEKYYQDKGEEETTLLMTIKVIEELGELYQGEGSYFVSEQACALIGEVQMAFCAGAWLAVIVLAIAVVDSQLREFTPGFEGSTKRLLMDAQVNPKLQQLRERRNAIFTLMPRIRLLRWINNGPIARNWNRKLNRL